MSDTLNPTTPEIGEFWQMRNPTTLPERRNETFFAAIAAREDDKWQITPRGHSTPWPIWFGREWFITQA